MLDLSGLLQLLGEAMGPGHGQMTSFTTPAPSTPPQALPKRGLSRNQPGIEPPEFLTWRSLGLLIALRLYDVSSDLRQEPGGHLEPRGSRHQKALEASPAPLCPLSARPGIWKKSWVSGSSLGLQTPGIIWRG
jgi:hypothetical protein